jgi:hypothetical protein
MQHTFTCSVAAPLPRRLCYRPAVFFRHLRIIAPLFPQEKFCAYLLKNVVFPFFLSKLHKYEFACLRALKITLSLGNWLQNAYSLLASWSNRHV